MYTTFKFPFQPDRSNGSLALISGVEAAAQTLEAWLLTTPGELLYFGDYGADLDYNRLMGVVEDMAKALDTKAMAQHSFLDWAEATIIPSSNPQDQELARILLRFRIGGEEGATGIAVPAEDVYVGN